MIRVWAAALLTFLGLGVAQAAEVVIINADDPGEGLNDPALRAPVGGNDGTTLGEQRRIALNFVADLLGSRLYSNVPIRVVVDFRRLHCTSNNATLASAGAEWVVADFNAAPRSNTFYPIALANAIAGHRLDSGNADGNDIGASFNASLDDPEDSSCLDGMDWYYGLDHEAPPDTLEFIGTVAHELIHGLGFATYVNLSNGEFLKGTPDIYARYIRDLSLGATWPQMSAEERRNSATNDGQVVWDGSSTTSNGAPMMSSGVNQGRVQLFTPNTLRLGSSISHWDTEAGSALMAPYNTPENNVLDGIGLSACLLQDIGWMLINNTRCPDAESSPIQGPAVSDRDSTFGGGGGSAGGCTLAGGAGDPLWPIMLLGALAILMRRSRRA